MKRLLLVLSCLFTFAVPLHLAYAEVQLPNYAQGTDLKSAAQDKGKKITDIVGMIAAICCIIGMAVGGGMIGVGKGEDGKRYLIGGIVGLIIVSLIYAIASYVF
jgi:hypothetical protein